MTLNAYMECQYADYRICCVTIKSVIKSDILLSVDMLNVVASLYRLECVFLANPTLARCYKKFCVRDLRMFILS